MKAKLILLLFPAMIWLAACDNPNNRDNTRNDANDNNNRRDTEVRVEERTVERDTVYIEREREPGIDVRVGERDGDVDFEIKGRGN